MADAARAGDVTRFVANPFDEDIDAATWVTLLGSLGVSIAALQCAETGISAKKIIVALERSSEFASLAALEADIVRVLTELGGQLGPGPTVYLRGVWIPDWSLDNPGVEIGRLEVQDSIIQYMELPPETSDDDIPTFIRCAFGTFEGRTGEKDLPPERFINCEFSEFGQTAVNTESILSLPLPLGSRVVLTLLKKLYMQAGTGRKSGALYRGLDQKARALVNDAISLLQREGLAIKAKTGQQTIWLPVRSESGRVRSILAGPSTSTDSVMLASAELR